MNQNIIMLSMLLSMVVFVPSQSMADAKLSGFLNIQQGGGIAFPDGILNSSKGMTGPIGPQGIPGPQGVAGPAGSISVPLNLSGTLDNVGVISGSNSSSTGGAGVLGFASATTGSNYGVYARSDSTTGIGVSALVTATTGANYGVAGRSNSTAGYGVSGYAAATSGYNFGVFGRSDSTTGYGVQGFAPATTGYNYGVYGSSLSSTGVGVYGTAPATTGYNNGVYGSSASSAGTGVYGSADAASGDTYGVTGASYSSTGNGVWGYAASPTGVNYGVWGYTASPDGYAGYFSGDVYVGGDYSASGLKNFVQPHPEDPAKEIVYIAAEAPEAMILHRGIARLESGKATIELPDYFRLVAHEQGIGVQITPRSLSSKGLAAYEVSRERVKVGELMDGTGSYEFDFIITAKRAGFETHEPIQANKHFSADGLSQTKFEKRHSGDKTTNRVVRNLLIKNGTLNSDGKLNKNTAQRLRWKLNDGESDRH